MAFESLQGQMEELNYPCDLKVACGSLKALQNTLPTL